MLAMVDMAEDMAVVTEDMAVVTEDMAVVTEDTGVDMEAMVVMEATVATIKHMEKEQ